jgi:hypothetical protein
VTAEERPPGPAQPGDKRFRMTVGRGMLAGAALLCALVLYGPIRFPTIWTGPSRDRPAVFAGLGIAATYGIIGWFVGRSRGHGDQGGLSVVGSVCQVNFDSLRLTGDVDDQSGGPRIGELLGKRKLWRTWG